VPPADAALLLAGGLAAGVVNTLAGGGSLLTVPLLVLAGLPGTVANGTNRLGILLQNGIAAWSFRAQGVSGPGDATPLLAPVALGAVAGALVASRLPDALFEQVFGALMLVLLVPTLWPRALARPAETPRAPGGRRRWLRALLFLGIGFYGGAVQAGVGILLVFALSYAGFDLVRANSVKVIVNFCFTALALPVFVLAGEVAWGPAVALGAGYAAGGALGARVAVRGGERVIRPVLAVAVVALAGRMIGLYCALRAGRAARRICTFASALIGRSSRTSASRAWRRSSASNVPVIVQNSTSVPFGSRV
jgi:uncharacterized membrane protein YfcA